MRKTFKFICAAVVAAFAVSSCYDDSKLWEGLEGLEQRVAALEEKLNSEVKTLNGLISTLDGKVKELTAADENLLAKLTALNTQVESASADAKTALAAVNELTAKLDAADGKVDGVIDLENSLKALDKADGELDGKLESLSGELKGLSTSFAAEISKIAVVKVEENKDGSVTLTLADGSKLTVGANAENTGLVTVIDGEWHVYRADGTTMPIDVPVGVEDLKFRVNDSILEFSVNGGKYVSTGIEVKDYEEYEYLVEDFWSDGEFVYITFGGVEYTLPLYKPEVSVDLMIKSGISYFNYNETQTFDLSSVNLSDIYVMNKPDGWKVVLEGKKMTVTAPVEENTYAELTGFVLLHGNNEEGKCIVAKLEVKVGAGLTIIVDNTAGTVRIINPIVETVEKFDFETYEWISSTSFAAFDFGLASVDVFNNDPENYFTVDSGQYYAPEDEYSANWETFITNMYPNYVDEEFINPEYNSDTYTIYDVTLKISDLYKAFNYGKEMEPGSSFVVWAMPYHNKGIDDYGMPVVEAGDLVYRYYEPIYVNVSVEETTHNDIKLSFIAKNSDMFQIGKFENNENDYYNYIDFEYLYYKYESMDYIGVTSKAFEGTSWLSEWALEEAGMESSKLKPNTEYKVYVIPNVGKPIADYDYETELEPYIYTFKTNMISKGGSTDATATLNSSTSINQIVVDVTGTAGTTEIYYHFFSMSEYSKFENDEDYDNILAEVIAKGTPALGSRTTAYCNNLQPSTKMMFVAVAVAEDGTYGTVAEEEFCTQAIPYVEDGSITVSIESVTFDSENSKNVTVVLNVTGANKLAVYSNTSGAALYYSTSKSGWAEYLLTQPDNYQLAKNDVVDGKVTVNYTNYSSSNKYLIYSAYNVDASNKVQSLTKASYFDLSVYQNAQ